MNGLAMELGEWVDVIWLDATIRENEDLELSYGLRGHPAFAVLDESGVLTAAFVGPQSGETLRDAATAVLPPAE